MIRGIRQYKAISANAFKVTLSDPVYLVLLLAILIGMVFFSSLPSFSFGSEIRFVRDQALALLFIGGCLAALLGSLSTVVRDLRLGATAVLMSRPVSGFTVIAGKLTGLIGALAVFQLTAGAGVLWVTRIAGRYGHAQVLDTYALCMFLFAIVLAMALAGLRHYFLGGWFAWQASLLIFGAVVGLFLFSNIFESMTRVHPWGTGVDWRTGIGVIFLFLAEVSFLSIILVLAVSFDASMVLGGGVVIFLLGMISQYIAVTVTDAGWLRIGLSSIFPNWQVFWVSDVLAEKGHLEYDRLLGYMASCGLHTVIYSLMMVFLATWFFKRKEICSSDNLQED